MVTAVAARLFIGYVVLFTDYFHIRAAADDIDDLADIFDKFADQPDSGDIIDFFRYLFDRHALPLGLVQECWTVLPPAVYTFDIGILSGFPAFRTRLENFSTFRTARS